jgi:hypothetical protein
MEDPNVIRTETRLRLPIFGQLPDVGHRKLAMCLNLGECQIAEALSHRYCTCRKIAVIDLSRSEYNMPTSNKS